jgi:hypothetical protein
VVKNTCGWPFDDVVRSTQVQHSIFDNLADAELQNGTHCAWQTVARCQNYGFCHEK